jgi:hypothetical protein
VEISDVRFAPESDMFSVEINVCFVPKADISLGVSVGSLLGLCRHRNPATRGGREPGSSAG